MSDTLTVRVPVREKEAWQKVAKDVGEELSEFARKAVRQRVQAVQARRGSPWDDLLGSNLKAPFFLAKALSAELLRNHGCIVNIVDIHAERGLKDHSVYSIAKAGLVAMTKVLAKELGPNVRVNAVAPGAIIWPEATLSESEKDSILQRIVLNRQGDSTDIAKTVRFLIEDAGYMTGQVLTVDGGRTLNY